VIWSDLDEPSADAAIAEQVSRFAEISLPWEWKYDPGAAFSRQRQAPRRLSRRLASVIAILVIDDP
jgi:hypothetical protein